MLFSGFIIQRKVLLYVLQNQLVGNGDTIAINSIYQ